MDIYFRGIGNSHDEISMGHKYWFQPAVGCDAMSATANVTGFTPLIAAARHFGWDYGVLEAAASACNDKGEVAIITAVVPKLFLVPATKAKGNSKFLIEDLLKAVIEVAIEGLHFTHYGFLQGHFPEEEISDILRAILSSYPHPTLQRFVFDIDIRAKDRLYDLMRPRG